MYRSTCLIAFLAVVACAYAAPAGETSSTTLSPSTLPPRGINSGVKLENRPLENQGPLPERQPPLPILEKQTPILETPRQHQLTSLHNVKSDHDSSLEDHDLDTDATHHYGYYAYYAPGWSGWVGRTYGWHDGWRSHYWY